jgi:hypothetical protein
MEGDAQETTYHITYFDTQNRNLQPEIEKIVADFTHRFQPKFPPLLYQESIPIRKV